jgi:hypothetical protein
MEFVILKDVIPDSDRNGARSKTRNVFSRSNTGIMCSNPIGSMDVCPYSEWEQARETNPSKQEEEKKKNS